MRASCRCVLLEHEATSVCGLKLVAGVCYWSIVFPLAVIKNRIQAAPDTTPPKYAGMLAAGRDVMTTGGWRGFYAGFLPCILRAVPANAACFVAFEMIMRVLPP
jgi:solute carrier family 25 carnitine/acylcarnitine transporter 20/29